MIPEMDLATAQQMVEQLQQQLQARHPGAPVQCLQTHISWVLLAGDKAYKLRKPLNLGFLDYSTRALRRHGSEEELRLNRRTAPELYEALRDAIAATKDFDGVTGKVSFDEYGDNTTRVLTVYEVKGDEWADVNTEEFK